MIITIENFLQTKNRTIELKPGVTLFRGKSGTGKTTVLRALKWCLYKEGKGSGCNVKVTIGKDIFYRTSNPCHFMAIVNGTTYTDQGASKKVVELFGPVELWNAACCIHQKFTSFFATCPVSMKFHILNSLAFHEQDPGELTRALDEKLSTEMKLYSEATAIMKSHEDNYNQMKKRYDPKHILSEEEYQSKLKRYQELKLLIPQIRLLEEENLKNQEVHRTLSENLKLQKKDLLPEPVHDLNSLIKQKSEADRYELLKKDYDLIQVNRDLILSESSSDIKVREIRYLEYIESLKKYNVTSDLDTYLTNLKDQLDEYVENNKAPELLRRINQLEQIRRPYSLMPVREPVYFNPYSVSTPEVLVKQITELEHQKDSMNLSCPECKTGVHLSKGKLLRGHVEFDEKKLLELRNQLLLSQKNKNIEEENQRLKNKYLIDLARYNDEVDKNSKQLELYQNAQREIRSLHEQLRLMKIPRIKSDSEFSDLQRRYDLLKLLKPVEKPKYGSRDLLIHERELEKLKKQESIKEELEKINYDRSSLELYNLIHEVQKVIDHNKSVESHNKFIDNLIEETRKKLSEIKFHEISTSSEKLTEELNLVREQLNNSNESAQYKVFIDQYESKLNLLSSHNNQITKIKRIREIAVDKECQKLASLIDQLNERVQAISNRLFPDKPCLIKIKSDKDYKSKKITKKEINLEFLYDGRKFNSITEISGGESDRVAIAITAALFSFTKFPLLFLDEAINSLDIDNKILVYNTLTELFPDRKIVIVCHDILTTEQVIEFL